MPQFHPAENGYLIVQLPGERLRAIIKRVVNDNAVIVELTSMPLKGMHNYKRGDFLACRRKETALGEIWEAVADNKISIEQIVEQEEKAAKVDKPKKKKAKKKKAGKK